MSTSWDYSSIMKSDQSDYTDIMRSINRVTQKLGSGKTDPVPYDTAWVARVPKKDNLSSPAFPECLQWLRVNQRDDGSWGAEHPYSLHSNILNTFVATLALFQWNYPSDEDNRKRAIKALTILTKFLPEVETKEKAFEMIMSGLIDDAIELKLDIPYKSLEWCYAIGRKELRKIERQILSCKPSKYWVLLEAIGRKLDLDFESFRPEIIQNGLIAAQPATTAFILRYARLRGSNFQEAEWTLKELCSLNGGGIPHLSPCDNFEIIYGLDVLFKVDINPRINVKHVFTKTALDTLIGRLNFKHEIGFSSKAQIVDDGCSSTAFRVTQPFLKAPNELEKSGRIKGYEKRQNGKSRGLVRSQQIKEYLDLMKVVDSSEAVLHTKKYNDNQGACAADTTVSTGTRNISVYYDMLQKTFDFQLHETKHLKEIVSFISRSQNNDGGWGERGTSSIEETAYVCLAIFRLVQTNAHVVKSINLGKLGDFINRAKDRSNRECFWCYKVNFYTPILFEAAYAAAKYALFQVQRLCIMTDVFNENRLDYLATELYDDDNEPINPGYFLLTSKLKRGIEIEENKQDVLDCFDYLFPAQDDSLNDLIDTCIDFSYFTRRVESSPYDRAIHGFIAVFFFLIGDVFHYHIQEQNTFSRELNEFLDLICNVLSGDYTDHTVEPTVNFPRFPLILKWSSCFRKVMVEKKWKPSFFANILKSWLFNGYLSDYRFHSHGIKLTSKRYLQIQKNQLGLVEIASIGALLDGKTVDITAFQNHHLLVKYLLTASKASRIRNDVPSAQKDFKISSSDNYAMQLQNEYGSSFHESLTKATKKSNKELLKMYCFKKMILKDPKFQGNRNIKKFMKYVESYVEACLLWSLQTPRYAVGQEVRLARVLHENEDVMFIRSLCFDQNE